MSKKYLKTLLFTYYSRLFRRSPKTIGILCEEIFHKDFGIFGGYGMTVKRISSLFQSKNFRTGVIIPTPQKVKKTVIKKFDSHSVLLRSNSDLRKYPKFLRSMKIFLTIDYYPSYEIPLLASPKTPIIVYIRDPKGSKELENSKKVSGESIDHNIEVNFIRSSMNRLMKISKHFNRRVIFATNAKCLISRAEDAYGIGLAPHYLPNPVEVPNLPNLNLSKRPSFLFIGRLSPQKRPWIVFELARRMPNVDFIVAGPKINNDFVNNFIKQYDGLPNLFFKGVIEGDVKDSELRSCWALINTSYHEGLPVTFLEAFAYAKPVISSVNPDNLVENFGFFVPHNEKDGLDENTIRSFMMAINCVVSGQGLHKGMSARNYILANHTFDVFFAKFKDICKKEQIQFL